MAEKNVVVTLKVDDQMSKPIADASKKVNTSLKESKGAFSDLGNEIKGSFTNAIKGAVLAYASFEVVNKITQFLKDGRREFQETQRIQQQLKQSLGATSQALNDQALALSKKIIVDDDEISAVQAKLSMYVKNEDAILRLTPAVLDLAAATGMDMASAAQMVARGIADDSEELGRFKISVEGAKGSTERINSVIKSLNNNFKDQSIAIASAKDGFDIIAVTIKGMEQNVWGKLRLSVTGAIRMFHDLNLFLHGVDIKKIEADTRAYFKVIAEGPDIKKNMPVVGMLTKEDKEKLKRDNEDRKKLAQEQLNTQLEIYTMIRDSEIALMEDGIEKEFALLNLKYEVEQQKFKDNKIMLAALSEIYSNDAQGIITRANKKELDSERERINAIISLQNNLAGKRQDDISDRMAKNKKLTDDEKLQARQSASELVSNLEVVANKHREFAGLYKSMAIAKTIWDTYEGAQAAFTSLAKIPVVGVPLGIAAATAATAAGLARVQSISAQSFATGTAWQGGGMSLVGENGPEYVNLPRGASVYNNTQTRNMTTNAALNVTIMDSSGNITETIRAQLRSGQGDQLVRDIQRKMAGQL